MITKNDDLPKGLAEGIKRFAQIEAGVDGPAAVATVKYREEWRRKGSSQGERGRNTMIYQQRFQ